jgi:hypothetical protein
METYSLSRRIFTTNDGRIGLGPMAMRTGDLVVILFGSTWPFVLRPYNNKYKMCGVCYLYGVMFGEAVDAHKIQAGEDEVYQIR